jgi:glycosyltransferase involved in cell wall biosynthesis
MSPLTAGCLYVSECAQWEKGCGGCPQLGIWPLTSKKDATKHLRKVRTKTLISSDLHLITPSLWLKELTSIQIGNGKSVTHINNGINSYDLSKINIPLFRKELLLNQGVFTIVIVAGDLADVRKGFHRTIAVLQDLHQKGCVFQIILLGHCSLDTLKNLPPVDLYVAGYISDHETKMKLISAADLFLFMSSQDNQPLTVLEALVQGTKVIGYPTGGVSEISSVEKFYIGQENLMTKRIAAIAKESRSKKTRMLFAKEENLKYGINVLISNHVAFYEKIMLHD